MATYSSLLRLAKPAVGGDADAWGTLLNGGMIDMIEAAVSGRASVTHDDAANYTLTTANGAADEARNAVLNIAGTLTAARNAVVPTLSKLYIAKNATTGGFDLTVKTSGGTGITIPNGKTAPLMCDGTNVIGMFDFLPGNITVGGTLTVTSTIGASNFSGTHSGTSSGTNTGDQTITLTSDVTGSGTGSFATTIANNVVTNAKLADMATNTIKARVTTATGDPEDVAIAANQFIARSSTGQLAAKAITDFGLSLVDDADATAGRSTLGLGTIATQSAASVAITGGSITGLTAFQLRNAGTGAFDLQILHNGTMTAGRNLTLNVNDAARAVSLSGDLTVSATATVSGTNTGDQTNITGNAGTATALQTARTINGTSFNGTANITTASWGTSRTITIGSTGKAVDGSAAVSWTLGEIGAPSTTGTGASGTWGISITGNAETVDGYSAAESASGSTVAARNSSGYLFAVYFNQSSGNSENPGVSQIMVTNGSDNYLRKASLAHLKSQMSLNNVENTALSTWAGSGNITTVGTITSGSWSANVITVARGGTGVTSSTGSGSVVLNTSPLFTQLSLSAASRLYLDGGGDTYIYEVVANQLDVVVGGSPKIQLTTTTLYFSTNVNGGNSHQFVNSNATAPYGPLFYFSGVDLNNNTTYFMACQATGTIRMQVQNTGNLLNTNGSYGTLSDAKFKSNVVPANSQWDDVKALARLMVNYESDFTVGKKLLGWVAQDVQEVSPGVVHQVTWGKESALAMDDMTTMKKGFKALGEALERIEKLEAVLAANNITIQ